MYSTIPLSVCLLCYTCTCRILHNYIRLEYNKYRVYIFYETRARKLQMYKEERLVFVILTLHNGKLGKQICLASILCIESTHIVGHWCHKSLFYA